MVGEEISIYEPKQAQTVAIWAAFDALEVKGLSFAERPVGEVLVDDRNTIQHRFGSPDPKTVSHYVGKVLAFCKRILQDHYGLDLVEVLKLHVSSRSASLRWSGRAHRGSVPR